MYGELLPVGGGDPIPLLKTILTVGRRESCDVVLRFPNVSGNHCELSLVEGYWSVKDLGSSNGTKVNGTRVAEQRLEPGDKLSIAKHEFEVSYDPVRFGAMPVQAPLPSQEHDFFGKSLLERAGLVGRRGPEAKTSHGRPRR